MGRRFSLLGLLASGCMAQGLSPSSVDGGPSSDAASSEATACAVDSVVFAPQCAGCHRADGQIPELTFDALPALIESGYVVPGDPAESPLQRKITGTQLTGGPMPPGAPLSANLINLVDRWIAEGASVDCEPSGEVVDPMRHHPQGWPDPSMHGTEMKLGLQACRNCHGGDLTGGLGPSCDSCHQSEWRTTCTYCHGGTDNPTGAPPRDLSGVDDALTFVAHTEHVEGARHAPYDCSTCHTKPTDVLTANHVFDDTPGQAEVQIAEGRYDGDGRCTNLYCHGNGQTRGSIVHTAGSRTCDDCHAGPSAGRDRWETMSGEHSDHLREGVSCSDCHAGTTDAASTIIGPDNHVNGRVDLSFAVGTIARTGDTCSGVCHGEDHSAEIW